ncbi:hypothetical protein RB653_004581 [Dictyostelium firmibasis]|uniref:Uncharacterized protein n=1 Tax=Dictyostelium firmibasis TaxID=79012 RepID=A0AAN7YXD6_9MYCE
MTKNIFIIIVFVIFFFNFINSLEIIISIDFNSNINYSNNECGGSIKIILKNNSSNSNNNNNNTNKLIQDTSITYPPCKSFNDAYKRSKELFNNKLLKLKNTSLIFLISKNFNWREETIKITNGEVINIQYYCYFEIKVDNDPNAILTIDGSNTNYNFLNFTDYSSGIITCDQEEEEEEEEEEEGEKEGEKEGIVKQSYDYKQIRINLYNIKFINWKKCLAIQNFISKLFKSEDFKKKKTTISKISNIITYNTSIFLDSWPKTENAPIKNIINNCSFYENYMKTYSVFIDSENEIELSNSSFNNMILMGWFIINEGLEFKINNINFKNITIENNNFIDIDTSNIEFDGINVENCSFSNFFYNINDKYNANQTIIKNVNFKNNKIINGLRSNIFSLNSKIDNTNKTDDDEFLINLENIKIESNNEFINNSYIDFILVNKMNVINLKNISIPEKEGLFFSSISSQNLKINIDSNSYSLFNSKVLAEGENINIYVDVYKSNKYLTKNLLLQKTQDDDQCNNCFLTFKEVDDVSEFKENDKNTTNSNDSKFINHSGIDTKENNNSNTNGTTKKISNYIKTKKSIREDVKDSNREVIGEFINLTIIDKASPEVEIVSDGVSKN